MCNQIIIIDMIISNVFVNFSIHIDTTIEGLILDAWQVPHISGRFSSTLTGLTYYYSNLWQVPLKTKLTGSPLPNLCLLFCLSKIAIFPSIKLHLDRHFSLCLKFSTFSCPGFTGNQSPGMGNKFPENGKSIPGIHSYLKS